MFFKGDTRAEARRIIAAKLKIGEDRLGDDTPFTDFFKPSLAHMANMTVAVALEEFEIETDDSDVEDLNCLDDVVKFLEKRLFR